MDDAKQLWSWWQSLLASFGPVFTRPGWVRFVQWVTGMVMGWEEHTITQILVSMDLESRWRAMEQFAEYGAWDRPAVERRTISLIERDGAAITRWGWTTPSCIAPAGASGARAPFTNRLRAVRTVPRRCGRTIGLWRVIFCPVSHGRFCPIRRGSIFAGVNCRTKRPFGLRPNGRWNCYGRRMLSRRDRFWLFLTGLTRWRRS